MDIEERKILANRPITWTGDLSDDCTAEWAGLMLRAESMDEDYWWWAVYDMQREEVTIDDSNGYEESFPVGEVAREKAENVARKYIADISAKVVARFLIAETFKITGRGLVFAGYITEGSISTGYTIEFVAFGMLRRRKIGGVEGVRKPQIDKINTGLLIKVESEYEIDELRGWDPGNEIALIFK